MRTGGGRALSVPHSRAHHLLKHVTILTSEEVVTPSWPAPHEDPVIISMIDANVTGCSRLPGQKSSVNDWITGLPPGPKFSKEERSEIGL